MRFRLLCATLVAVPVITGLAAPARQDVVQKTASPTASDENHGATQYFTEADGTEL